MALELNRVVAEILARSSPKGPPVIIASGILSAAQLEAKDFLAGKMSDADEKTINAALADARAQLTGVAVAAGEPVPPLALTQAMLDLAALTPPVVVPADVVDAARTEQAVCLANGTPLTPLQREALAKAYAKVEALLPAAKTGKAVAVAPPTGAQGSQSPVAPVPLPPITVPEVAPALAKAKAANLTIQPSWETSAALESTLIASGANPTADQMKTLDDALAAIKAVLPK